LRDEELWELLERAGAYSVVFGVESLNQSTLDDFSKRTEVDGIHEAMERVERFKINIIPSFIIGDVEDPLEELRLIKAFWREYHHRLMRVIVAPLMEYPFQRKHRDENQLIADEQFIHHDWDYYSGDFLYFYPRAVPPSVLQKAMVETIKATMGVPYTRFLDPVYQASAWFVRHTYAPTDRRIAHYIEWLKTVERGKYDRSGHLLPPALAGDEKLRTLPIAEPHRPFKYPPILQGTAAPARAQVRSAS